MTLEEFKAAAAQIEPEYHDKEGTVDKTCKWIDRAGAEDVDLVVFPEAHIPGFPYWCAGAPRWGELMVELKKNSLQDGDNALEIIGDAVAEADLYAVIGGNELDSRPGSDTVYNVLYYFNRDGEVIGKHRKLKPTLHERTVWGEGDPSSLQVYDTELGNLGGLICYENHMTLSKAALCGMGEEIHVATWPGFWELDPNTMMFERAEDRSALEACDAYSAMRQYAFETQSFVVSSHAYISDDLMAEYENDFIYDFGAGGSMLIGPSGILKEGPVVGKEELVTATYHRDERRAAKAMFDAMGHYTRWDAVNLNINRSTYEPISTDGTESPSPVVGNSTQETDEKIDEIASEHDIDRDTVAEIAQTLSD
jgi:amidase/nitrilase